ncbi:MAG: DUF2065 domain-containing protein [Rhodospirillales bacterium]|nr:MAG: DUF2065 domain-containing protein [Rhodospirillales bacterium]
MADLITAIGLALVIEGAAFALFPRGVKHMMLAVMAEPSGHLRWSGLFAIVVGCALVWLVRG